MDSPLAKETLKPSAMMEKFRLFHQLPFELRLQIWWEALNVMPPRVVTVRTKWMYRARATYEIPALLRVNHEARYEALKKYQPSFPRQLGNHPAPFDLKHDTLYFDSCRAFKDFYGQSKFDPRFELDIWGLRHVAIGGEFDFRYVSWRVISLLGLYSFVVTEEGYEGWVIAREDEELESRIDDEWWKYSEIYKTEGCFAEFSISIFKNIKGLEQHVENRAKGIEIWKDGDWRKVV